MNRRSLLKLLAGLPFVGRWFTAFNCGDIPVGPPQWSKAVRCRTAVNLDGGSILPKRFIRVLLDHGKITYSGEPAIWAVRNRAS